MVQENESQTTLPKALSFISVLSILFGGFLLILGLAGGATISFGRATSPIGLYSLAATGMGALQIAGGLAVRSLTPRGLYLMFTGITVNIAGTLIGFGTGVQQPSGVALSLFVNLVIATYLTAKRSLFGLGARRTPDQGPASGV
jgi:hypothetical protein